MDPAASAPEAAAASPADVPLRQDRPQEPRQASCGSSRVVFDWLEEKGVQRDGESGYSNPSGDICVGQTRRGWSSGLCCLALRVRTGCGVRRLGLTSKIILDDAGHFICPDASDVPVRLILPANLLRVNDVEFKAEAQLTTGTEIRLMVDLDNMAVWLRVADWDSGVIKVQPQTTTTPVYPYFVMDAGDSFELLPD